NDVDIIRTQAPYDLDHEFNDTNKCDYHNTPLIFLLPTSDAHRDLHSFPTRRSSDLPISSSVSLKRTPLTCGLIFESLNQSIVHKDRKSTRLNSSHVEISYAVFCLKKKINTLDSKNHTTNITKIVGQSIGIIILRI